MFRVEEVEEKIGLIRSMLNNALFRVKEVQDKERGKKDKERKKESIMILSTL